MSLHKGCIICKCMVSDNFYDNSCAEKVFPQFFQDLAFVSFWVLTSYDIIRMCCSFSNYNNKSTQGQLLSL